MDITAENGMLRCEFQYRAEIVERIKTILGAEFDKQTKCWWVPVSQADRLIETFPTASYSLDAVDAALSAEARRIRNFHEALVRLGVRFEVQGDTVVGVGESISPLLAEEIAKRSVDLRALVNAQEAPGRAQTAQRSNDMTIGPMACQGPSVAVREPTLVERGIVNAAQKEQRQYGRRPRRKPKLVQGDLLHGA